MSKKDGQKYLCYLPLIEEIKSPVVGGDKRAKLKKPDEYMEVLKDRCFYKVMHLFFTNICFLTFFSILYLIFVLSYVQQEGWWFYEFCHEKSIRQFHPEQDKVTSATYFFLLATIDICRNYSGLC